MGGYQSIINKVNTLLAEHQIYYNTWRLNTLKEAEASYLLDLVIEVYNNTKTHEQGSIKLSNDNKKLVDSIKIKQHKPNNFTQYMQAIITKIKHIIKEASIQIIIEQHKKKQVFFQEYPKSHLIMRCDTKSKLI